MTAKLLTLSALALTVALTLVPIANAQEGMHKEDCVLNAIEKLDLNAEQKLKVKLFVHKAKMEITLKHLELHTIRKHIHEAFHSGNMNMAKINKFAKQKERVMGSIAKIRMRERYKIYLTLNAEQREKVDNVVEECLDICTHD